MTTWLINDATPESLGIEVVGGTFRSGSASSVQLRCSADFDAAEILSGYGGAVVIKRNGTAFFKGTIRAIPKSAASGYEGQDYLVEDAWADLERTVYQEFWNTGTTAVLLPRCFLGVDYLGNRITLAQQITEALNFAIAAGVDLQVGSVPTGMLLWPTEVDGMSCAEVIRTSLRYHPDWIPWIDHTTTPPTFQVTPRSTATALAVPVTDCMDLSVTEIQDRLPDVVRICFITANEVDGVVSRAVTVQKHPTTIGGSASPDSGPGVLSTTIDMEGVRASYQKQQIKTRTLPTDAASCKAWLKKKYPAIKDVPDAAFDIAAFDAELVTDGETNPPPINPNAERLAAATLADVPRELVAGSIHEWMRRDVGQVRISFFLGTTGSATEDEKKLLAAVPTGITVTATDAVTKTYKGLASYSAGESIPSGVAESYYNTIRNGCRFEGDITILTDAVSPPWHGKKLNLTGGVSGWATMAAPIHGVQWDAQTDEARISFGPTPDYSVQDFMEFLKLLRKRRANWISTAARISEEIENENGPETVGPLDTPRDIPEHLGGAAEEYNVPFKLTTSTDDGVAKYRVGKGSIQDGTNGAAISLSGITETETTATAGYVVIEADVDASLVITGWTLAIKTDATGAQEVGMTTTGTIRQNKVRLLIGKLTLAGDVATPFQAQFSSVRINVGLINGIAAKVFEDAPTYPTSI
jgi:hypothetical protein